MNVLVFGPFDLPFCRSEFFVMQMTSQDAVNSTDTVQTLYKRTSSAGSLSKNALARLIISLGHETWFRKRRYIPIDTLAAPGHGRKHSPYGLRISVASSAAWGRLAAWFSDGFRRDEPVLEAVNALDVSRRKRTNLGSVADQWDYQHCISTYGRTYERDGSKLIPNTLQLIGRLRSTAHSCKEPERLEHPQNK